MNIKDNNLPKPFLKWAGGKRQILNELRNYYPKDFNRYFEPFLGGGAVFFDLIPKSAVLSDLNKELINCYIKVRDEVDELINKLKKHIYDKEYYYNIRSLDGVDSIERASRTIFLNRTGYNGLYRVNKKGQFNVPFGRHINPQICDEDNLQACSGALKRVDIESVSFEVAIEKVLKNDFVYFDPPYIPISSTANFTAYDKIGFGMNSQEKLAKVFEDLDRRKAKIMLSNSNVSWVVHRYKNFNQKIIKAKRSISCNGQKRDDVFELIITNY